jgi:excisionase family DNA binding protein
MMSETVPRLLTLLEVADKLRVSPHTVRAWIRQGRLQPVRLCRRLLFSPTEILRLLGDAKETADSQSAAREGPRVEDATTST